MNPVLIDTSVWVGHFRHRDLALIDLLESDRVLTHPMVWGELACGTPPAPRVQTLQDLRLLQPARQAGFDEVLDFIEREMLFGLGCGWVDMVLLVSTLITPQAELWTLDKRLAVLSERFGAMHRPAGH